ncbi:hypothetical protein [Lichenifustis flavocetrariae]|uniref:Uncharacterized protein n=1 Tax=Lichenifustis flavocetrariae TaxID=2949735 RepID=A0AA41Z2F0_9HYPH|nr:hypothetical protein [Lichenifustis flavocetrariae]MCW6512974.1 hypothetical protein [Lichenifustis flavocetrariae]
MVKLYGAGRYFLCRHCYRLAHASQSEDSLDRARRRSNTIRTRLGGEAGPLSTFPQRPKGMWNRTYERLLDKAIEADVQAEELFAAEAARLLARLDRRAGKRDF